MAAAGGRRPSTATVTPFPKYSSTAKTLTEAEGKTIGKIEIECSIKVYALTQLNEKARDASLDFNIMLDWFVQADGTDGTNACAKWWKDFTPVMNFDNSGDENIEIKFDDAPRASQVKFSQDHPRAGELSHTHYKLTKRVKKNMGQDYNFKKWPFDVQAVGLDVKALPFKPPGGGKYNVQLVDPKSRRSHTLVKDGEQLEEWELIPETAIFGFASSTHDDGVDDLYSVRLFLRRRINGLVIKEISPVLAINILSFATFEFKICDLEARLAINLTLMLVLTTIMNASATERAFLTPMDVLVTASVYAYLAQTVGFVLIFHYSDCINWDDESFEDEFNQEVQWVRWLHYSFMWYGLALIHCLIVLVTCVAPYLRRVRDVEDLSRAVRWNSGKDFKEAWQQIAHDKGAEVDTVWTNPTRSKELNASKPGEVRARIEEGFWIDTEKNEYHFGCPEETDGWEHYPADEEVYLKKHKDKDHAAASQLWFDLHGPDWMPRTATLADGTQVPAGLPYEVHGTRHLKGKGKTRPEKVRLLKIMSADTFDKSAAHATYFLGFWRLTTRPLVVVAFLPDTLWTFFSKCVSVLLAPFKPAGEGLKGIVFQKQRSKSSAALFGRRTTPRGEGWTPRGVPFVVHAASPGEAKDSPAGRRVDLPEGAGAGPGKTAVPPLNLAKEAAMGTLRDDAASAAPAAAAEPSKQAQQERPTGDRVEPPGGRRPAEPEGERPDAALPEALQTKRRAWAPMLERLPDERYENAIAIARARPVSPSEHLAAWNELRNS